MKIAVDAMGGDHAPDAVVHGTVQAAQSFPDIHITLFGQKDTISHCLGRYKYTGSNISVHHTTQIIEMGESPVDAIRRKKDSSLLVMADMASKGAFDAIFSAGNTGALVACSTLKMRYLKGVERPGIATPIPTPGGTFVLIDAGATVDCRPVHLLKFALMGQMYAKYILKYERPRVGLINVGEEESKGSAFIRDVHTLLSGHDINFIGNIEGRDVFSGRCEVIVCDGFIGNVVLKVAEGTAKVIRDFLKSRLRKNPVRILGAMLSMGAFREFKKFSDHEECGGAPLLGVNGISIIGHGSSSPKAIKNAIRVSRELIYCNVNEHIEEAIKYLDNTTEVT